MVRASCGNVIADRRVAVRRRYNSPEEAGNCPCGDRSRERPTTNDSPVGSVGLSDGRPGLASASANCLFAYASPLSLPPSSWRRVQFPPLCFIMDTKRSTLVELATVNFARSSLPPRLQLPLVVPLIRSRFISDVLGEWTIKIHYFASTTINCVMEIALG